MANSRRILSSVWVQVFVWSAAFVIYHYLSIAAGRRTLGVTFPETWPLYCFFEPVFSFWVIAPVLIFTVWLATLHWYWRRESRAIPIVLLITVIVALNMTTAMTRGGVSALWLPFTHTQPPTKYEYFADIDRVGSNPLDFIRNYPELGPTLALHSSTHPPGAVLYLWAVSRIFGSGIVVAALSAIVATACSIYPFYLLARFMLGATAARYAVAMYSVTPALVLYGATCMDGLYIFFPVLAAYFFHRSWENNRVRYSILTGLALSASMFFTFMTVCVGFIFTIEAILSLRSRLLSRRIWGNLIYAGATFITVHCLLYLTIGYNVVSGFEAARIAAEVERTWMYPDFWHYLYASTANLTAFLIQTGIVTVALWGQETAENWAAWWKKAGTDFLSISLSVALIVLAFATIFCAETERVWMFLMPLVILAAARQLDRNHNRRGGFAPFAGVLILLFAQTLTTQLLLNNFW